MAGPLEELKERIRDGQAVFVVGVGVSVGATGNAPCASWQGLLRSGLDRIGELGREPRAGWQRDAVDSGDVDEMIGAAELITKRLDGPAGGEFRTWLRDTVGALEVRDASVLESMRDLGVVLATTNYDDLIENVTGLEPVTWMDGSTVERVLRGDEPGVLHLHGYWKRPESVILGIRSYEQVLNNAHAQAMQHLIAAGRTLVFVGCRAGLQDPNFGGLLAWAAKVFSQSEYRRFLLALDGECAEIQKEHPPDERLFVIGYGPKHADLAGFLRGLKPAATPAPAPPPPAATVTLPPKPACFGRERDLEKLVAVLLSLKPDPVPILGSAGIGKTNLAISALHDPGVAVRYGARRIFLRCDGLKSRADLVAALAGFLGLQIAPGIEPAVLAELGRLPGLLVLDNAETPWEGDTLAVEELLGLLGEIAGLALVVTLRGNQRPAGVGWSEAFHPSNLDLPAARSCFLAASGREFESDPRLDALIEAVDRLPLALQLLGRQAEGEPSLESVWERWQAERTAMLQAGDGCHRLTNLELSYEISLTGPRMTAAAVRLLRMSGQLPGGLAHQDIDAVMPGQGLAAAAVLRKTGMAFDESGRLRTPATLREYMKSKYQPQPEDDGRLLSHFLDLATRGDRVGAAGGADAVHRLSPEIANIEALLLRALSHSLSPRAVEVAPKWGKFVWLTGAGSAQTLKAATRVAKSAGDVRGQASCLKSLGNIALGRSDHRQARARYEEALPLFRQVGDVLGEANCIQSLGDIALRRSDHGQARARYEEALPLYRQVGSVLGEVNCIYRLGDIALERSDHRQARARYEEALPLYRQVGDVLGEANCIYRLGDIALERSEHAPARTQYAEALPLYRQVGDVLGEANCIWRLGQIALVGPEHGQARARYEEALLLYRQVGSVVGEANCILTLGDIALRRSDHGQARAHYEEALPLFREVRAVVGEANCIQGLGDNALASGDRAAAAAQFTEALELYERVEEPYSIGWAHVRLARLASDPGDLARHVSAARQAWSSIDRPDLIKLLDDEFGTASAAKA